MEPTYIEISRACGRVLRDVYEASNRSPGVGVASAEIRQRIPMNDELWKRVCADLRHLAMVCHDGDEGQMKLTAAGVAQACIAETGAVRTSTAA